CKAGRVKWNGQQQVKPSHVVKVGDTYHVQKGLEKKVLNVKGMLGKRVDAKTAVNFYEDITPLEETFAYKSKFQAPTLKRDRGAGRPTNKDRREIDELRNDWWDDE